ncbi:MAG: hypothetical protein GX275_02340 [Clostridiales bacterium]|nr:hypothetical protein [Clostridiales bacterium]
MKRRELIFRRIISLITIFMVLISNIPIVTNANVKEGDFSEAIEKAINYIDGEQNKDGSFGGQEELKPLITSRAVKLYKELGIEKDSLIKAEKWINENEFNNNDFLGRVLPYLNEEVKQGVIQDILLSQNSDGGFGLKKGYGSDILDTILIIDALKNEELNDVLINAINYIVANQNEDGSWSNISGSEGDIKLTGLVRSVLINIQNEKNINLSNEIKKSSKWLTKNINTNNKFMENYYLYLGLYNDSYDYVTNIAEEIKNNQKENGSCEDDIYKTILMADLLVKDKKINEAGIQDIKLLVNNTEVNSINGNNKLTIKPEYSGRNCTVEVLIVDAENNEYSVNKNENEEDTFNFDPSLNKCGEYKVRVNLKDSNNNIVDTMEKTFNVEPYLNYSNYEIKINPYVVLKGKEANPNVYFNISSETNIKDNCEIITTLEDKDGNILSKNNTEKEIVNGNNSFSLDSFHVDKSMTGVYKVRVKIKHGKNIIFNESTNFRVIEKSKSLYTLDSDFDKGVMSDVSYEEEHDQLQLSKQFKDFKSKFFTLKDIVIFSYEDNTEIKVTNPSGNVIYKGTLNKGEQKIVYVNKGVYNAEANNKFAILTGDPVSNGVVGYYAMDANGYGASKEIYTFVPKLYSSCKFILFAMEDNTEVTLTDIKSGDTIYSGTLNKGEHYENSSLSSRWLHITANNLVSALTDYDQSYFVPSTKGNWSGNEFYTHVGNTGGWAHDLTVMSYEDNNNVIITDTNTKNEIWSGVLQNGESKVIQYRNGTDTYITVNSSGISTVAVQPWVSSTGSYHQGVYAQDKNGAGLGRDFIATSLNGGNLYAIGYKDNTKVDVYNSSNGEFIKSYFINVGEYVDVNPRNGIWRIKSNNDISLYSGWGTASAGFTPVEFGGLIMAKEGNFNVINEADSDDFVWSKIAWNDEKPEGSNITVKAKAANSLEELENATYKEVSNGVSDNSIIGRFVQVQVDFTSEGVKSPILKDIFIGSEEEYKTNLVADAGDDQAINIGDNDGAVVKLDGSRSYDSNGRELSYKWTWDGGEAEGVNPIVKLPEGVTEISLIVNNGIQDSEADTVKIKVSKNKVDSNLKTDKENYSANENVLINNTLINPLGIKYKLLGDISIYDSNGVLVENVENNISEELKEETKEKNINWNTKLNLTGKYTAVAKWSDEKGEITSSKSDFYIIADENVRNNVSTDKRVYGPNEGIKITQGIYNESKNNIENNLKVKLTINNPNNEEVFTKYADISELFFDSVTKLNDNWNTEVNPEGEYKVISEVYNNETLVSANDTYFNIEKSDENTGVKGEIFLDKDKITKGDILGMSYKLLNVGNSNLDNLDYSINLIDTDNVLIENIHEDRININVNDIYENNLSKNIDELENGNYLCVLSVKDKDGNSTILDWKEVVYEKIIEEPKDEEDDQDSGVLGEAEFDNKDKILNKEEVLGESEVDTGDYNSGIIESIIIFASILTVIYILKRNEGINNVEK